MILFPLNSLLTFPPLLSGVFLLISYPLMSLKESVRQILSSVKYFYHSYCSLYCLTFSRNYYVLGTELRPGLQIFLLMVPLISIIFFLVPLDKKIVNVPFIKQLSQNCKYLCSNDLSFPGGASGKEPRLPMQEIEMQVWSLGQAWQHTCLENPMDRGAWQATVHRVAQCQTGLK